MSKTANPVVKITNARLSFPALFTARKGQDDGADKKPKFEATFLLHKTSNAKDIAAVKAAIDSLKASPIFRGKKPSKICLRRGDDTEARAEMEGYGPDVYSIAARSVRRPAVVDRDLSPLTEDDSKIYAGCYVNATVELYPYSHKTGGLGIAASLRAVQFVKDGEAFGSAPVDASKEFDALPDDGVDNDEDPV